MIKLKSLISEVKLKSIESINNSVLKKIASVAQKQYDQWEQNEEGYDEELGTGGICHLIADDVADILTDNGIEAASVCSNYEQHVYLICKFKEGVFRIDIPYSVYETGGGYNWKKLPDVKFDSSHIEIDGIDNNPNNFDQYVDY